MKKLPKVLIALCLVAVILVLGLSACGGGDGKTTAPAIAKVRMWITLSSDPDATPVTTLTPEQTVQASIWARGITAEDLTFKINLSYGDKLTTLATNVHTEGGGKAVAVGGFASPLEPGTYIFQAISGAFGGIIGSMTFTVASATAGSAPSATAPVPTLLEEPDMATFNKYFMNMGLGRMPPDAKSPQELQRNVAAFTAGDQLTLYGTVIQEVQISAKYYSVATKQSANAPAPPTLKVGGFASSSILDLPIGKYEYKVYVGDVLVGVFPFEVLVASTATQTPQTPTPPSEQPDMATYQKYFSDLGIGKLPAKVTDLSTDLQKNATVFTAGDQICLYGMIIQECQVRDEFYDVAAQKVVQTGGLPKPMTGGFAGWESLTLPVGKYECKVYVGDILVGVFPFEVR